MDFDDLDYDWDDDLEYDWDLWADEDSESYWCPIGQNGQTIKLETSPLLPAMDAWMPNPGIYMLASISKKQGLRMLYIGETDNFRADPLLAQKSEEAIQQGAGLVFSQVIRKTVKREWLKQRLVQIFQPPMNNK
jgi:hypothetical protein